LNTKEAEERYEPSKRIEGCIVHQRGLKRDIRQERRLKRGKGTREVKNFQEYHRNVKNTKHDQKR